MKPFLLLLVFAAALLAQPQVPNACGANGQTPCTVVTDGLGNVTLPGSVSVGNTFSTKQLPISIVAEGADPTGVLNSTTAITSAIVAAGSGGSVLIPCGLYKTHALTIAAPVTIADTGGCATLQYLDATGVPITITSGGVSISKLTLDGNSTAGDCITIGSNAGPVLSGFTSTDTTIKNCGNYAIDAINVANTVIVRPHISGGGGIIIGRNSPNSSVVGGNIDIPSTAANAVANNIQFRTNYTGLSMDGMMIDGVTMTNGNSTASCIEGGSGDNTHSGTLGTSNGAIIRGNSCTATNNIAFCYSMPGNDGMTFGSNYCNANGYAISSYAFEFPNVNHSTISNNVLLGNTSVAAGMMFDNYDTYDVVSGNVLNGFSNINTAGDYGGILMTSSVASSVQSYNSFLSNTLIFAGDGAYGFKAGCNAASMSFVGNNWASNHVFGYSTQVNTVGLYLGQFAVCTTEQNYVGENDFHSLKAALRFNVTAGTPGTNTFSNNQPNGSTSLWLSGSTTTGIVNLFPINPGALNTGLVKATMTGIMPAYTTGALSDITGLTGTGATAATNLGLADVAGTGAYSNLVSKPRMVLSQTAGTNSTISGAQAAARFTPDVALTITRVQVFAGTAPLACSTWPVIELYDVTAGADVASTTVTLSGGAAYDSGAISTATTAGHVLELYWKTGAVGCSTNAAAVSATIQYY